MRKTVLLLALLACGVAAPAQALLTVPLKSSHEVRQYRLMLKRIRSTMVTVEWKEAALADVVKDLGRRIGLNVLIATPMKERAAEDAVDLALRSVSAATVMKILAEQHAFDFQNREGIVWVTSREDAVKKSLVLELYSVAGLLYTPPDFPAPEINLTPSGVTHGEEEVEPEREQKDPEFLLDLVRQATGTKNWEIEGVSLTISKRTLVVRHTPEMQRRVRRFLGSLRGVF